MTYLVREPAVAGLFYPHSASELRSLIDSFLSKNSNNTVLNLVGCILPHAGLAYCGHLIASLMPTLSSRSFKRLLILGPSHHIAFDGASIYAGSAYRTPLGDIPIDFQGRDGLFNALNYCRFLPSVHANEHCVEVLLPFFQMAFDHPFELLPIVTGQLSDQQLKDLTRWISEYIDADTLVVASSDFSHFYSASIAERLDECSKQAILSGSLNTLDRAVQLGDAELCGAAAVKCLMALYPNAQVQHLGYQHSGALSGDLDSVVGYHVFSYSDTNGT